MSRRKTSKDSLLWSISKKQGPASFLFGTMHVRSDTAHQFLTGVLPFIAEVDTFAAEMDLQEFDLRMMQESTTLPAEKGWNHYVNSKRFNKMRNMLLKSFGVDLNHYQDRHPFLIISAISESLLSNDNIESLDQELWNRAAKMGKFCTGLESFYEQMNIMSRISVTSAFKQLHEISRNPGRFRKVMEKMIGNYVSQDVTSLYKASRRQLQGLRKMMLFNRNERMADRLEELMLNQTVFSGVGAAHLGGKYGMLCILKKRGYRICAMEIREHLAPPKEVNGELF